MDRRGARIEQVYRHRYAAVPPDAKGFFRYEPSVGSKPTALMARNAQGDEVYRVSIPPGHASGR